MFSPDSALCGDVLPLRAWNPRAPRQGVIRQMCQDFFRALVHHGSVQTHFLSIPIEAGWWNIDKLSRQFQIVNYYRAGAGSVHTFRSALVRFFWQRSAERTALEPHSKALTPYCFSFHDSGPLLEIGDLWRGSSSAYQAKWKLAYLPNHIVKSILKLSFYHGFFNE